MKGKWFPSSFTTALLGEKEVDVLEFENFVIIPSFVVSDSNLSEPFLFETRVQKLIKISEERSLKYPTREDATQFAGLIEKFPRERWDRMQVDNRPKGWGSRLLATFSFLTQSLKMSVVYTMFPMVKEDILMLAAMGNSKRLSTTWWMTEGKFSVIYGM